ncbi:hypothetical protein EPUS_01323 [Endocarpon pusillum Z07020]|uniref:Tc1-like transposase DDE domain-containing protein n=1 Tax=Endocarpon pusillum (strain Z07020 / HMAS-L-300199) TaxID=1263415 RepID=U1GEB1_ENDPU|nr:uncharacterized protein EPUS_01323 [Endocarpon pusillum Z07020]ERF75957.1 hypothetical protein EPUS_01323 [Endocarpon pusillum Z07020]
MLDTPRRARLLADARHTAGKLPRTEPFKIHNISETTGYRIIKEGTARRSQKVHNRGRKQVLAQYECEAIEAVEDANFGFASSSHFKVAKTIGIANGSERAIQRNIKLQEVQRTAVRTNQCPSTFCDMAVSINSVQLSLPQAIIAGFFLVLGFLYFAFQISELTRVLLSTFVTPGKPLTSFGPRGSWALITGASDLGIKWEMNPPTSPDLNPIETIWRIIKQRLKSRGVIFEEAVLRRAIQEEWDKITLDEINRAEMGVLSPIKGVCSIAGI